MTCARCADTGNVAVDYHDGEPKQREPCDDCLPKATPGEWYEYVDWGIGSKPSPNESPVHIASVSPYPRHGNPRPREGKANMALLKSAPKLAAALEALLAAAPTEERVLWATQGVLPGCVWCDARIALRDAGRLR